MSAYSTKKFKLLRKFDLDFYIPNSSILSTQNVAQFLLLESRFTGKKFLSANCHLLFDRNRGDTKYFQAALIMSAITEIQKLFPERNVYTVWGGDFNTLPCSPLYNYVRYSNPEDLRRYTADNWTGQYSGLNLHAKYVKEKTSVRLSKLCEPFDYKKHGKYLHTQSDEKFFDGLASTLDTLSIKLEDDRVAIVKGTVANKLEPLKLKSAYAEDYALRKGHDTTTAALVGEMAYSTIPKQDPYPVTTDYIFFTQSNERFRTELRVANVLLAPDADHVDACVSLPNAMHPSDHFPLFVNFQVALKSPKSDAPQGSLPTI